MSTGIVYAPALAHEKIGHPECNARISHILPFLEKAGVLADLVNLEAVPATAVQLEQVHNKALVNHVQRVSGSGGGLLDYGDTYATAESYDLARLAAGAGMTAVDAIMRGEIQNGFALVRPPGHHAEQDRVSGFCLFNNVAVAARHAQREHETKRVLIVDFDVHHGNGTQDIFYRDDSVLFVSIHLFVPRLFYPGTGSKRETGFAGGKGYTLNVPLMPYVGDAGYGRIFQELIRPKAVAFQPDIILVSAGFDAHWRDPLAMAGLSLTGYAQMGQALRQLADELCDGRILFIFEGGYEIDVLSHGILNLFYTLLGQDNITDPYGPMPQEEPDIASLLAELKQSHLIY
ncbi:MAG TPA: histone deacetylase [Anaerolineae bacterium]|nr:histone deacetylase [Anaerolineae bacterium]